MKKADYSLASQHERENVIQILQRNANRLIEHRKTHQPDKLRLIVDSLCTRIRDGEVITGKDFENLVQLFQRKTMV